MTVIVITGGGRGIGAATARALAARGARVAIGDIDAAAAAALAEQLPGAVGLHLDVTDPASYRRFIDEVEAALGPLDVLVANAGVMWVGAFDDEPVTATRRQIAVNLEGVITGFRLAAPAMRHRRSGQIVVVASAASKLAPAGEATYAATKHAVYGYCTAVREELRGTGVDVSVLMPTVVATDLAAGTSSGKVALLTPAQVAAGVLSLIDSRRPELFLPRKAGLAALALAVTPARLRAGLHRFLVPNQVKLGRLAERRAYQSRTLDAPDSGD
ncbi:SDR family NAD(P)-dependent oxidoreductase [Mycolicibacterium sp. J2]|uniref:SDR family NAD(P)-dependent oxidoreductase n=1 Tax=Mycolicibacterium sp. J2 TaxID=2993511 RepID=UPI00224ABC25|nr:SDR family NAD(P)-dependent oxidoreductase [Mycolicibacterium sp. J2]MCX2712428.1 SDR family NAD(P)-dependent oxidoreductase [Mycolicibacterium sp. J2]